MDSTGKDGHQVCPGEPHRETSPPPFTLTGRRGDRLRGFFSVGWGVCAWQVLLCVFVVCAGCCWDGELLRVEVPPHRTRCSLLGCTFFGFFAMSMLGFEAQLYRGAK